MACDLIVAAENAQFGQPEINLGIIPGAGGTQRLTRAVGKSVAMDMILTGRRISAQEALQFGLVARVFPTASYLEESIALAAEIADKAPLAVRMAKEAINRAFESTLAEGVLFERRAFNLLFATEDQKEGMAAFIEKRKPSWKGR
jgi:enoyl-CoA hydratase